MKKMIDESVRKELINDFKNRSNEIEPCTYAYTKLKCILDCLEFVENYNHIADSGKMGEDKNENKR